MGCILNLGLVCEGSGVREVGRRGWRPQDNEHLLSLYSPLDSVLAITCHSSHFSSQLLDYLHFTAGETEAWTRWMGVEEGHTASGSLAGRGGIHMQMEISESGCFYCPMSLWNPPLRTQPWPWTCHCTTPGPLSGPQAPLVTPAFFP